MQIPFNPPQTIVNQKISSTKKQAAALNVPIIPPTIIMGRTPYFCPKIPTTGPEKSRTVFRII